MASGQHRILVVDDDPGVREVIADALRLDASGYEVETAVDGVDITIRAGVASVTGQWPALIPLLQHGRLKAEGLFSHRMPLSAGAEAYRLFDAREDGVVKIMIGVDGF